MTADGQNGFDCASLEFLEETYARFLRAPDSVSEEWRRRFPAASSESFAEAGHYLMEDARDGVLAAMERFLGDGA